MGRLPKLLLIVAAPFLLASCLLTPGRFTSTLDINADRSFTFTYQGEVMVIDPSQASAEVRPGDLAEGEGASAPMSVSAQPMTPAQGEAIREALGNEAGYRSVEYLGDNKFRVDYSISGRLDRGFVFPFNIDAVALLPWVAVEVRNDRTVRVTGLAFGNSDGLAGGGARPPTGMDPNRHRDGTFTLTTDAELVMQNNERGATPGPRTTVSWRVTPTTRQAPTAVLRFAN